MATIKQNIELIQKIKNTTFGKTRSGQMVVKRLNIIVDKRISGEVKRIQTSSRGGTVPAYGVEQVLLVTGIPSITRAGMTLGAKGLSLGAQKLGTTAFVQSTSAIAKPKALAVGGGAIIGGGLLLAALFGGTKQTAAPQTQTQGAQKAAQKTFTFSPQITKTFTKSSQDTSYPITAGDYATIYGGAQTAGQTVSPYVAPLQEYAITPSTSQTETQSAAQTQSAEGNMWLYLAIAGIALVGIWMFTKKKR